MRRGRRVPMPPPARTAQRDWAIVCDGGVMPDGEMCTQEWATTRDAVNLSAVQLHFSVAHPDVETLAFRTVWRGKGPEPPTERVLNRQQRRAQEKRKGKR